MIAIEPLLQFLEDLFRPHEFPDYPNALNGLQVEGPAEVHRIGAAVDASERTILEVLLSTNTSTSSWRSLGWNQLASRVTPGRASQVLGQSSIDA